MLEHMSIASGLEIEHLVVYSAMHAIKFVSTVFLIYGKALAFHKVTAEQTTGNVSFHLPHLSRL